MTSTTTGHAPTPIHLDAERESLFEHYAVEADLTAWAEYDAECVRRSMARSQDRGPDDCPSCGGCGEGPTPETNCGTCGGRGWAQ